MDPGHHIGLVVGDSPGDDPAIFLGRLERFRIPQLDGVDRLHVVVLVQEQLATAGARHLCVERRHPSSLQGLDPIGESAQSLAEPVPRRLHCLGSVV